MDLLEPVVEPSGPVLGHEDGPVGLELDKSFQIFQGLELEVGRHEDCKKGRIRFPNRQTLIF